MDTDTDTETVNPQTTDGITQANVTAIASTPAYALGQSQLAIAQSQSALFANMVSGQQQQATAGDAAITQCVLQLLNGGGHTKKANNDLKVKAQTVALHAEGSFPPGPPDTSDKKEVDSDQNFFGPLGEPFTGPLAVY